MPPNVKPARKSLRKYQEAADLLPGLKLAASIALNSLNEIRSVLELPPFGLIEEPRPRPVAIPKPPPAPAPKKKTGGHPRRKKEDLRTRGKRKPRSEQRENREKLKSIQPGIKG